MRNAVIWSYNQLSWELILSKAAEYSRPHLLASFIDELLGLLLFTHNKALVGMVLLLSRVYEPAGGGEGMQYCL